MSTRTRPVEPSRACPLDDSAPTTFARLGTNHQLRSRTLSNPNVPVFRHCLLLVFFLELTFFRPHNLGLSPFSLSETQEEKVEDRCPYRQSTAISDTLSVSETSAYDLAKHVGHSSHFLKKKKKHAQKRRSSIFSHLFILCCVQPNHRCFRRHTWDSTDGDATRAPCGSNG